jgi:GAF domain-containing protein
MAVPRSLRTRRSAAEFADLVHAPSTEMGRLQRGAELVVSFVGGCDHAGVTVLTPSFIETVAASDDVVRRGDDWQHELSEGPGLHSVRNRTTVVSQDLRVDPRWRAWGPRAARSLGMRSALSVLLEPAGDTVGALTLYADRTDAWGDEQQALARTLARQLALATADARQLDDRQRALVSRVGLGQAQGIVMERFGLTSDEAHDYLQRLSAGTHVQLVHLAEHIVETRDVPTLGNGRRA